MFIKQALLGIILYVLTTTAWGLEPPLRIFTSIKPLALIVQEIAGADDSVEVLLPAGVSPHHFSMRISDMRKISTADLMLWVGPGLETFLQKPLNRKSKDKVLAVSTLQQLHWPSEHTVNLNPDHHDHGIKDLHLWLNPQNAIVIAQAVAAKLGALAPERAHEYTARAQAFTLRTEALDQKLKQMLKPVKKLKFAVYHNAYGHYMQQYGLEQVGYVTTTAEQRLGVKHMYWVEQQLKNAQCLLIEPYANMAKAIELARRAGITTTALDPLAKDVTITTYDELMLAITNRVLACHSTI